jgi:tetratricopeptide (TPR) repeat protein
LTLPTAGFSLNGKAIPIPSAAIVTQRPGFLNPTLRLALGVVAAALVGVGAAVVARREPAAAELQAAERVLPNDPASARIHLDRYLAREPNDGRALLLAAQAARRDGAYSDAERLLTAAEHATGSTSNTRLEWVLIGLQQGEFAEEEWLRSLVAANHQNTPAILEAFPKGFVVAERWPEAQQAYDMLLARKPDHVPGLLGRGAVLDHQNEAAEAERDVRRAVELAPASATAHAVLGGQLIRTGRTREAIAHFERSLELRANHAATLVGLSRALADNADIPAAVQRLDQMLALQPDHVEALVERGRLALRRGQADEAEPFLAKAVRAAPWHRDGHALRLIALTDLKRTADAAACAARIAELRAEDGLFGRLKSRASDAPSDASVRWELWQWCLRNGEADRGVAWLAEILHLDPRHTQARAAFAEYFDRTGQPRRAAQYRK